MGPNRLIGLLATTIMEALNGLDERCVIVQPQHTFSKDCVVVSRRFGILLEPILGEVRQRAPDSARSRISLSCVS